MTHAARESTNERDDFFAGLMTDHARIETRLAELEKAARATSRGEDGAAVREVLAATLSFFESEGACHEAHEELTLFPRLRSLAEFKQIQSALEFQHRMNADASRQISACLGRSTASGDELSRQALRFVELHRAHAMAEERALFPLAASRLPARVVAEMSREARERRQAAGVAGGS